MAGGKEGVLEAVKRCGVAGAAQQDPVCASWIIDSTNPAGTGCGAEVGAGGWSLPRASLPVVPFPLPTIPAARRLRRLPLAAAVGWALAGSAWAQGDVAPDGSVPGLDLRVARTLQPPPRGESGNRLPVILRADQIHGTPDLETIAEGNAEFRRAGTVIRADRLSYQDDDDLARASGNVRITRDGNVYSGPELQLRVERFQGYFLEPTYFFGRANAGGKAKRVDFIDDQRASATDTTYTSCKVDGTGTPAWLLETEHVDVDFATNEGVAKNAVLRFYGIPILAAPRMSFPLTDERKSGWLPPSFDIDSKSGFQVSVPYYWNIAPNRDATLTPSVSIKRGAGLDTELRYLEPTHHGQVDFNLLPHDGLTNSTRYAINGLQETEFASGGYFQGRVLRVSDDDYWKDFPGAATSITPRLLGSNLQFTQPLGNWTTYARVQSWQVLQTTDPTTLIQAPYDRMPQIGARFAKRFGPGLQVDLENEINRFDNPFDGDTGVRPKGLRAHSVGSLAWPYVTPGWSLTPKVSFNAAAYSLDAPVGAVRQTSSRVIPTFSLDNAWVFERDTSWFGHATRQTLEPRVMLVETPFRDQSGLPNFDSTVKDFNFDSIFTENAFSGVDRVSDANQLTAGVISRFINPDSGGELLRLGLVQRYLFREQRINLSADGLPDDAAGRHFSDLLLLASTNLVPSWTLDGTLQYRPDTSRTERSIVSVRYSPGPYRTISATYRLARGLSEQVELGWQWPLYGPTPVEKGALKMGSKCSGSLYGVGRVNYSMRDSRIIDSVVGMEYDAGCWIGRVVAERLSTGRSDSTTRLLVQLELVGLSRLGSNPLQVLKDNVPGYRLLRDDRSTAAPTSYPYD
jgi:LPS-assembly protein